MKKKILRSIASAVLVTVARSSLTACGSDEKETTPVGSVTTSQSQQDPSSQQTTQSNKKTATITETVMWDNDDIKVTALSLSSDQYYHIVNLQIENKNKHRFIYYGIPHSCKQLCCGADYGCRCAGKQHS